MSQTTTTDRIDSAATPASNGPSAGAPPHVLLWQLSTAAVVARCLHVVAALRVADAVGPEGTEVGEIAAAVGADRDALARILRVLAAHDVFAVDLPTVRHSPASQLLRTDHPQSMVAFAHMMGLPLSWESTTRLPSTAITGRAGIYDLDDGGLFSYLAAHPDEAAIFDDAMTAKSRADIGGLLDAFDFGALRSVADIGGGAGHLLRAIVERHPAVHATLVDLPPVIERAAGSAPPFDLVAADFFTDDLPVADVYVLMEIIHDWDDADAIRILTNLRRQVPASAVVLLVELVLSEGPGPDPAKVLDIVMLSVTGGRERTRAEFEALLDAAGFSLTDVRRTSSAVKVIEARPHAHVAS